MKRFILILFLSIFAAAISLLSWAVLSLPKPLFNVPFSTVLEDKNGVLLGVRIADDEQWRFPAPDSIPSFFKDALIEFEDRHFYRHPGVNPVSILRAARQNLREGRVVSGGSTLSMQVIRLSRKNPPRTIPEKFREILLAFALEIRYSKDEILTMYVTHAPFGGNIVGLEAASWRYYNRPAHLLSRAEAAALAVLPNSPAMVFPGRNQEIFTQKRNRLLRRLANNGWMDELTFTLSKSEPLPGATLPVPSLAPHLLDEFVASAHKGKRVKTTIDASLQARTVRTVEEFRRMNAANQIHHLAAMIVDLRSSEVVSYIGNSGNRQRRGTQVNIVNARRSPGSTLKPALFFMSLNSGKLLPDMLLADIPTRIGNYAPRNFNPIYDGAVPASQALARSLNIPAVRMLKEYGVPLFHHDLQQMGIKTLSQPPEHYGLSLILGGAEITMWDMAEMYASMAVSLKKYDARDRNTMRWVPAKIRVQNNLDGENTSENTFHVHPSAIWHTFEAMQDLTRPADEINWQQFTSARKLAWKTGTSVGFRDGWAVGLTPEYLIIVWAGNADGEGRPGLTGVQAAAPALFGLFNLVGQTSWFSEPVFDMSYIQICKKSGHRASPDCEDSEIRLITNAGLETPMCPYHTLIHLDTSETYRVHSGCEQITEMKPKRWFVLPPVMEWYYRRRNVSLSLPEWRSDCTQEAETRNMAFIYPDDNPVLFLPVELDGNPGSIIFEAAHRTPSTMIYWHLNEQFLGTTKDIHQVAVSPQQGSYTLTIVDANGERLSRTIRINRRD